MPTFIGKPVTVAEDKQLQVGDTLVFYIDYNRFKSKSLSDFDGKKKLSLLFHLLIRYLLNANTYF